MGSTSTLWKMTQMLSNDEKLEMMKLKDIYCFGISILEFMMGEVQSDWVLVALENIPSRWHDISETTELISILVLCLNF